MLLIRKGALLEPVEKDTKGDQLIQVHLKNGC